MAKIRNVSGEDRFVPWLDRVVELDETAEVPDSTYDAYVCQPGTWEGVSEPKADKAKPAPTKAD